MSSTPSTWIRAWFLISSLVVYWDAAYCLLRPHSMEGGSLNYVWRPYNLYAKIDHFYGIQALEANDGFTGAQAFLNLVESTMNLVYLYLLSKPINSRKVTLFGFTAVLLTLNKTVLYWLIEYFSGFHHIGHNTFFDLFFLWIIPNGLWIVVPGLIVWKLGQDLVNDSGIKQD
ncbi:uncharacterized protein BX664DRAFT_330782 [Halteromyces radiatus]|uniref:uncharacterized protein n=1 Tax=Halteromyces radiatus TaxID=101107 RepID=UPI00221FE6A3|nr:uncharacterized protein BX664DRAFT_330782 [Halteromyces radiatus]KAI8093868.1 hypothetical protein BX664DRAFT_330782 [Halteromyces radiatus]